MQQSTPASNHAFGFVRHYPLSVGIIFLLLSLLLGIMFGSVRLSPGEIWAALYGVGDPGTVSVILDLRLPRIFTAAHAGAVLAVSGLIFQTVLRNPLAEPYILGISGGAAVGMMLGIICQAGALMSDMWAFGGGVATLVVILFLGARQSTYGILLSGVMMNAFCGALILFLISVLRPGDTGGALLWFLGNLGGPTGDDVLVLSCILCPFYVIPFFFGHMMNLILLGDETALSLGVPVRLVSWFLLAAASFAVSLTVAAVGPLGFVGLVVPQALRLVFGADHRVLGGACLLYGASFMVLCDMLSRTISGTGEIPAGVITALIGAPLFILMLRRR